MFAPWEVAHPRDSILQGALSANDTESVTRAQRKLLWWIDRIRIAIEGVTSLEGPVELIDGRLTLNIRLDQGGRRFVRCARGISYIEGDCLNIVIPDFMAEKLGIGVGSFVVLTNENAKFNLWRSDNDQREARS